MDSFIGRIIEISDNVVVVEFQDFEVPVLADFILSDIVVPDDEELLAGYVVRVVEKDNLPHFEILGGFWSKEEVKAIQKEAEEEWDKIKDILS